MYKQVLQEEYNIYRLGGTVGKQRYVPHNDNIKLHQAKWICHKKPGCLSEHCFINPEDSSHVPLGHSQFDTWGSAMVQSHCVPLSITLTLISSRVRICFSHLPAKSSIIQEPTKQPTWSAQPFA